MLYPCPECGGELSKQGELWHCQECCGKFSQKAHCDKCDAEVERLRACGAVDYFCNACGDLKSKKALIYRYEKV